MVKGPKKIRENFYTANQTQPKLAPRAGAAQLSDSD